MTPQRQVEWLDQVEADLRSRESTIRMVRWALQDQHGIVTWDYNGRTHKPVERAALSEPRTEP